jgi:hypothetical protein
MLLKLNRREHFIVHNPKATTESNRLLKLQKTGDEFGLFKEKNISDSCSYHSQNDNKQNGMLHLSI